MRNYILKEEIKMSKERKGQLIELAGECLIGGFMGFYGSYVVDNKCDTKLSKVFVMGTTLAGSYTLGRLWCTAFTKIYDEKTGANTQSLFR